MASAQPSASARKIVFRAGTYVDGMPGSETSRSRGTAASDVSDDPPMPRRSTRQLLVARDAERPGDHARGLHFPRMTLPVVNRQRIQRESVRPRQGRGRVRIEAAAQKDDSLGHTPRVVGDQMSLCSCNCTRTGSRSAITHSDSVFGSRTSWTGENRIAAARDGSCVRVTTSRANS